MSKVQSKAPILTGRGKLSIRKRIIIMIEVGESVKEAIKLGVLIAAWALVYMAGYFVGKDRK